MSHTETVLLRNPKGGEPFIAEVPEAARLHDVPDRDGIDPAIRGLTFERTAHFDYVLGWPLFRPRSRQL